jgi:hypothetical protein
MELSVAILRRGGKLTHLRTLWRLAESGIQYERQTRRCCNNHHYHQANNKTLFHIPTRIRAPSDGLRGQNLIMSE